MVGPVSSTFPGDGGRMVYVHDALLVTSPLQQCSPLPTHQLRLVPGFLLTHIVQ